MAVKSLAAKAERIAGKRRMTATGDDRNVSVMRVSAKVAVLAIACAAGYGIANSPAKPAPRPPASARADVSAARQGSAAGDAAPRSSHSVTGGSGTPRVTTKLGKPQLTLSVTGWMVTAVGDLVMQAAAPQLQAVLPGIYVDAAVSRKMAAGLAEVRMIAAAGGLRRVVLVGLGNNGTVTESQINQLRAVIGPDRWLVLVNTYAATPWEQEVNAAIAGAARRDPRVLMVDWHSAIVNHTDLLRPDQIRPRPPGGSLYASVVKTVVETAS
jgi:hypothetical protein